MPDTPSPPVFIVPRGWRVQGFGVEGQPTVVTDSSGRRLQWWEVPTLVNAQSPGRNLYTDRTIRDDDGRIIEDTGAGVPRVLPPGHRWGSPDGINHQMTRVAFDANGKAFNQPVGPIVTQEEMATNTAIPIGVDPVSGRELTSSDVLRSIGPGNGAALQIDQELIYHLSGIHSSVAASAREYGLDPRSGTLTDDLTQARRDHWQEQLTAGQNLPPSAVVTLAKPSGATVTVTGEGRVVASAAPVGYFDRDGTPPPAGFDSTWKDAGSPAPIIVVPPSPAALPTTDWYGQPLTASSPGSGGGTTTAPVSAVMVTGEPVGMTTTATGPVPGQLHVPDWALWLGGGLLVLLLVRR